MLESERHVDASVFAAGRSVALSFECAPGRTVDFRRRDIYKHCCCGCIRQVLWASGVVDVDTCR